MKRYRAYIEKNIFTGGAVFHIKKYEDGKSFDAKIEWVPADMTKDMNKSEITLQLNENEQDGFFSALIRALEDTKLLKEPETVELKATERHLEDMRKLVFDYHG